MTKSSFIHRFFKELGNLNTGQCESKRTVLDSVKVGLIYVQDDFFFLNYFIMT